MTSPKSSIPSGPCPAAFSLDGRTELCRCLVDGGDRTLAPAARHAGLHLAGLLVFRLLWGLIGTRHARFADFVRGPGAVRRYVVALLRGRPEHHVGHNPAGALAIMALLTLGSLSAVTGWAVYEQLGGDWLSAAHDIAASVMLAVVGVHLLGVVVASWLHQENLVASMITGRKAGAPEQGIRSA